VQILIGFEGRARSNMKNVRLTGTQRRAVTPATPDPAPPDPAPPDPALPDPALPAPRAAGPPRGRLGDLEDLVAAHPGRGGDIDVVALVPPDEGAPDR